MMARTISLSEKAYEALAGLKGPGESFSDVALRLSGRKRQSDIMRFAGAWVIDEAEAQRRTTEIRRTRDEGRWPRVRS